MVVYTMRIGDLPQVGIILYKRAAGRAHWENSTSYILVSTILSIWLLNSHTKFMQKKSILRCYLYVG